MKRLSREFVEFLVHYVFCQNFLMSGATLALQGVKDVTWKRPFQYPGLSSGRRTISQMTQCKEVKPRQKPQQCCKGDGPFRKGKCSENRN